MGRIVGAQGAGINKLRDQLGVKVDVSDDFDEKESSGKKKKAVHQKSKVTVCVHLWCIPQVLFSILFVLIDHWTEGER